MCLSLQITLLGGTFRTFMAAIIAQLNIRNRAKKKRRREIKNYSPSKCTYELPPFDACFDPKLHNKYFRIRDKIEKGKSKTLISFEDNLIKQPNMVLQPALSLKRIICEGCFIGR